jgi:hypothetical protein
MADDEPNQEPEPTERLPRTGLHVPVPKRNDVMDAIRRVSKLEPDNENDGDLPISKDGSP